MALRSREPPAPVRAAVALNVERLAVTGAFPPLRDAAARRLALVAPHRIYVLPLAAVLAGRIEDAEPVGWRFLVADKDRIIGSAEIADRDEAAPSVHRGPYARSTAEAIERLERDPAILERDFELRLLKVPALYVAAAWIVDHDRFVIPLAPAPSFLDAGARYPQEDFAAVLRDPAERISALDDGLSAG